jgi:hypothetical protein
MAGHIACLTADEDTLLQHWAKKAFGGLGDEVFWDLLQERRCNLLACA